MNDEALMRAAARVDPVPPGELRDLARTAWGRRTFEDIVATPLRRGRSARRIAVAVAAAALVAGVVAVTSTERPAPRQEGLWAPRLVRMAQESPRLLVTAPGWRVTRADHFGTDGAEMTFENDRYWVDVYWYPGELYESYVQDRRRGADATEKLRVAGNDATLFRHDGTALGSTFYALWQAGPHAVELRTDVVPSTAAFREIAASVEVVDVDTWLAALPESVVKPEERRRAVEKAAAGLPIPPGLDLERVASAGEVVAGHSLELDVATAVVCGWIDHWAAGDAGARRGAVEALGGAGGWPVFRDGGVLLEHVEDVAAAMAGGERAPGGGALPVAAGYRRHMGCDEGG